MQVDTLPQAARYDEMQKKLVAWWNAQPSGTFRTTAEVRDLLRPVYGHQLGRNPQQLAQRLAQLARVGIIARRDDPDRPGYPLWGRNA